MQLSDLVRRIRSGEKEAVKELVAAYGSAVYQRAYERTGEKELAREAARQTFGQFVAIVQQQPEDDGWSLWFGDLIERNISTYAQISADMRTIETALDHELVAAPAEPAMPAEPPPAAPPAAAAPAQKRAEQRPRKSAPSRKPGPQDEIFDEPYREKSRGGSGHAFTVVLLILVSLLLLWVVAGVAMTMQWVPYYDLGYSWFNQAVFKLF